MELSNLQLKILSELDDRSAETQRDLAVRVSSKQPSVSRAIRPLLDSGLVKRDDDGNYLITPTGHNLLQTYEDAKAAHQQMHDLIDTPAIRRMQESVESLSSQALQIQASLSGIERVRSRLEDMLLGPAQVAAQAVSAHQEALDRALQIHEAALSRYHFAQMDEIARIIDDATPRIPTLLDIPAVAPSAYNEVARIAQSISQAWRPQYQAAEELKRTWSHVAEDAEQNIRRMAVGLSFVKEIQRTFLDIGIFDKLQEVVEGEREAAEAFRAAGWPIAPSMPKWLIRRVVELYREEKAGYASQSVLGYYRRDDYKYLIEMVEGWRDHPRVGEKRMNVIDDAVWVHCLGKYTLSVPALLWLIESILTDYVAENGLTDKLASPKVKYEKTIGEAMGYGLFEWAIVETLLDQLSENIYKSTPFDEELKRSINQRHISRHTVYHGIMPAYNRESYSLRILLILDALLALPQLGGVEGG